MPAKSEAQFRAMAAAASGKSTLGIPAKVGREFTSMGKPGNLPEKKRKRRPRHLARA